MVKIPKELMEKYKDVLNKPFCNFTEKDFKRFSKFLEENSKIGLTDKEIYKEGDDYE